MVKQMLKYMFFKENVLWQQKIKHWVNLFLMEFLLPQEVCHGSAGHPLLHKRFKGLGMGIGNLPFRPGPETGPTQTGYVAEKKLGIQPRRITVNSCQGVSQKGFTGQ